MVAAFSIAKEAAGLLTQLPTVAVIQLLGAGDCMISAAEAQAWLGFQDMHVRRDKHAVGYYILHTIDQFHWGIAEQSDPAEQFCSFK